MSRKKGAARKRRRKPPACPRCHLPADPSPSALLTALAAVLNAAEQQGNPVRFRHGDAWSHYGVVIHPMGKSGWVARPFVAHPESPGEEPDDLDT